MLMLFEVKISNSTIGIQYGSIALEGKTVTEKGKASCIITLAVHISGFLEQTHYFGLAHLSPYN